MLFDLEPKGRREDLYDFEEELRLLERALKLSRIILVKGIKRTGKTSLMRTALNDSDCLYVYLDTRFSENPRYLDFINIIRVTFEKFLEQHENLHDKIRRAFSNLKWIRFSFKPVSIEVTWRGGDKQGFSLVSFLSSLNALGEDIGRDIVIAIDEAQELSKIRWIAFDRIFAYSYDNFEHLKFVLSGSQVGLLERFIKKGDPDSPLYGREIVEVPTRRLNREESLGFLRRGFSELKINVSMEELVKAVDAFDGIIGWLTYFGHEYAVTGKSDLSRILDEAVLIAKQEVDNFLSTRRSQRHTALLGILTHERTWSEAKRLLEETRGETINDRNFWGLMSGLINFGITQEKDGKYVIADPIIREAVRRFNRS